MEEQHRYERLVSDPLQAFDAEQQESSGRRKTALVRYTAASASFIGAVTIVTLAITRPTLPFCHYEKNEALWLIFNDLFLMKSEF